VVGIQRHRAPEQMVRGFAKRPSGASIRSWFRLIVWDGTVFDPLLFYAADT